MTDIYDQHDTAFANVSAFVIAKDGERVATIAFKFGAAVTAYVHWCGGRMVRGRADGGGYDRKTAACSDATRRMDNPSQAAWLREAQERCAEPHPQAWDDEVTRLEAGLADWRAFRDALAQDSGRDWSDQLRDAGFDVWQAV